jgi:hypothetical protein
MPDGGRFEGRLRGKGWRAVYHLGCSSAPVEAVVDKIMGAAAHLFRSEDTKGVRDIYQELQDASELLKTTRIREGVAEQAFLAGVDARVSRVARASSGPEPSHSRTIWSDRFQTSAADSTARPRLA